MSTADFEEYFPFEAPARQANMSRWRRMGRLWLHNGVVQGVGEQFLPLSWEPHNQRFLLGTGAAVVEGFYGATTSWHTWVQTPGNDGMVKARLDPGAQQVQLCYEQWHGFHDDPWAAHGIVETPLVEVWPDGRWADRRIMVSPDVVEGMETIPAWVPKGHRWAGSGPAATAEVASGGICHQMAFSWMPEFAPGRHYRVAGYGIATQGNGWSDVWLHLRAFTYPQMALFREARIVRPLGFGANAPGVQGWSEFLLPSVPQDMLIAVQAVSGFGNVFVEAHSCYIEVQDLGQ